MFRFLHSADLHLGRRFGQWPEALAGRLTEARHTALARLAAAARAGGARAIVLAGDVFDSPSPARATIRQALAAMAAESDLGWVLMPGNHDPVAAEALWEDAARHRPANVTLALAPGPLTLAPGVALLPAPCARARPTDDPTAWMDAAATPEGALRIGLAHGPVQTFGEEGRSVIAPDRPARAGLDYLALGDWHGTLRIGPRAWYSGTPEPDRFGRPSGSALLVAVAGPGAEPEVAPVPTGLFAWREADLALLPGEDPAARLAAALPAGARRETLVRIRASGRLRLAERAALRAAAAEAAPDFADLALEEAGLGAEPEAADLDAIDPGRGALRAAAERLATEAADPALAPEDRAAAEAALLRLHAYVVEEG